MSHSALSITGLSHRYPHSAQPALDNLHLSVPSGSCFGLLGPNGAGKTTLLSLLTGQQALQQGELHVNGVSMRTHASEIKTHCALVPQDYAFYLQLTGRENLRFFADVYGLSAERWRQQLDYCVHACQLEQLLDKRAAYYSGGMKRRLNLAIGLLNAPRILYLDEPTVGIDALSRQVIIDTIRQLRDQGTTLIYTSHYMEEIEALCDYLAVINHGHLITHGSTTELLQRGAEHNLLVQFTRALASTELAALARWRITALASHTPEYELSLPSEQLHELLAHCAQQQLHIVQLKFGTSRLEQLYLSILSDAPMEVAS